MAVLTKKSKIFIKAKLTVSKSYLLGFVSLMYKSQNILGIELYIDHFFLAFHNLLMILVQMEVDSKYHLLMVDSIQN